MGEITKFVELYIKDSDILPEFANEFSLKLRSNIKAQLYEGHGRITGNLKRNIRTDTRVYRDFAMITGYYDEGNADYGIYVLRGIRGKAEVDKIDFLGDGLSQTMALYR